MTGIDTLLYVMVTGATSGLLTLMLFIVYRRYRKLQAKIILLEQKTSASNRVEEKAVQNNQRVRKHLTDKDIKLILDLYKQGYSYRRIAKIVGVSHTTVGRVVKKYYSLVELVPPEESTSILEEESLKA